MIPGALAVTRPYLITWAIVFGPLVLIVVLAAAAERLAQRAHARRAMDQAAALVCRACIPGEAAMGQRCTCTSRCGHLDCIGDHTTTFPAIREDS